MVSGAKMGTSLRDLEIEVESLAMTGMAGTGEAAACLCGFEKLLRSAAASEFGSLRGTASELLDELISNPACKTRGGMESALIRLQAEFQAAEQSSSQSTALALAQD